MNTRNLELFANFLFREHYEIYEEYDFLSKSSKLTLPDEDDSDSDDEDNLHQPLHHLKIEDIERETRETPIPGDEFQLKGTRFMITFGAPVCGDGTAIPNAASCMEINGHLVEQEELLKIPLLGT